MTAKFDKFKAELIALCNTQPRIPPLLNMAIKELLDGNKENFNNLITQWDEHVKQLVTEPPTQQAHSQSLQR